MANNSGVQIQSIGQIAIPVKELEPAIAFYRDTLGLKFLFQAPPGLAFFDCGGVRLMLDTPAYESGIRSSVLYFKTRDIRAGYEELKRKGVKLEGEPHIIHRTENYELWMSFFRDTAENILALMEEKKV